MDYGILTLSGEYDVRPISTRKQTARLKEVSLWRR
jgi:hypothetical protein